MLIREKTDADYDATLELLLRVHARDGYPMRITPDAVPGFLRSGHPVAAWVAEDAGRIVGHVALHCPPEDPTLTVASRATGLPVERLALVARLFVAPELRRSGLGRRLLRHAAAHAPARDRRAVLDVGQELRSAVALYEAEGWDRVGELHEPLDDDTMLHLWVYVSPSPAH
ncbi:putative GCN5-related N-acetyltransferase [Actinoplanes missouriensis 431]|uniref:Putative GCN5-related N-acetyltransferase n=1 Tax=Actinoplanes missouriensis (strain ATCC 14538 / DSM 43046 / CBS 188.64 / JCM 3121 / NBRC 102363 / NCIMB 12654 / NRRL B-3342 / UNCC 431) TaxID=512565 RepID=I0H343_ACTM4|nr:GNAT family N-acetyltransferase [Actinoplanes missouriensis]BAL87430.1 putative GCN5-related N-acetyltransferase [Actinoplanes missouriensis 431]